jgi:hypothetical protein
LSYRLRWSRWARALVLGAALHMTEVNLKDSPSDTVDVTIKMPKEIHDDLHSFCTKHNLKLDDVICQQTKRWLLGQILAMLEASEGNETEAPKE